ncbi:hypothetical protein C1631_008830 [Chryseobacterium phosphatilyticum]|uniref:Uncharacterized protein n=1 Tax=Chryseobacterium phosphatilyticum TaxID=475075 RepID=A0A316XH23_9FLAO|nr:hypothetical protein [Chryseobacterium phosphatilyticum]PWN70090.1 hypothetical protein C1631_008830 [Chryseobacterium phosphatilyticum]
MEVKKEVLRKLPTSGLLQYVNSDSKYVSLAVKYAYEILKNERNVQFSDEETKRIEELIAHKEHQENVDFKVDQNILEDSSENEKFPILFSKNDIILASTVINPIVGGALLFFNLKKIDQLKAKNIFLIIAYLIAAFIAILLYNAYVSDLVNDFIIENLSGYSKNRYSLLTFRIAFKMLVNFLMISFLWDHIFDKQMKYRIYSATIGIIIFAVIYLFIIPMFLN